MSPVQRSSSTDPVDKPRPGREPEGATFESARVGARRAWPPVFVIGFVALLTGVVAIGIGGRTAEPTPGIGPAAGTSIGVGSTLAHASPEREQPPPFASARPSPDRAPVVTSDDGPIVLTARRHPETVYVHGDVFLEGATWVFLSLQDPSGRVAGWASVSIPGAAGPGVDGGPTVRFDLELAMPEALVDRPISIQATAYDSAGRVVASSRLELERDGGPGRTDQGAVEGFRPGVFFPLLDATWDDFRSTPPR